MLISGKLLKRRKLYQVINENKPRIPFGSTALQLQLGL